jgi:RNA polymerase sigma factor (sigma-70 family)
LDNFFTENTLIEQLRQGDEKAYKVVCAMYQDRLYNTILCIVQSVVDAEDLTQEVFVEAFLKIDSFKGESKLSTWLYGIAINKALFHRRYWRAKKRLKSVLSVFHLTDAVEIPDLVHPAALLEQKEQSEQIFRAIDNLPEKQRIAFILRQSDDLSYAEIAQVMHTTIPSVESLLFRAKQNLKNALQGKV